MDILIIRGFYVRVIHIIAIVVPSSELSLERNWFRLWKQNSNSSVLRRLSFQGIQRSTFLHLRQRLDRCSHNSIIVGIISSIDVLSSWYRRSRVSTQRRWRVVSLRSHWMQQLVCFAIFDGMYSMKHQKDESWFRTLGPMFLGCRQEKVYFIKNLS